MDPNGIEEDMCTLHGTMVVLPRVEDTPATLPQPERVAWALLTAPRPGATVRDFADAFTTAAAGAESRLREWGAAVDLSDCEDTAPGTAHEARAAGAERHEDAARRAVRARHVPRYDMPWLVTPMGTCMQLSLTHACDRDAWSLHGHSQALADCVCQSAACAA